MKNLLIVSSLLLCIQTGLAQDSTKVKYELGSKLASLTIPTHLYYSIADNPYFQFLNSLFFRVSKKRVGLRAVVNYSQHKTESFYESTSLFATISNGSSFNKDFQIAVGGQYNLLKKKDYLYVFTDMYYRNVCSTGELYFGEPSYANYDFNAKANIIGLNVGLGFKITLFKRICLSPEIYCDMFHSSVQMVGYSENSGGLKGNPVYSLNNVSLNNIRPVARVFLTVKF